jgi:hypothetical protein
MSHSIIANRLADGLVVFYIEPGQWTERVDSAAVFTSAEAAQQHLELARGDETACLVIDPNLIDVAVTDGHVSPTAIREAIRAFGPTPEARTDTLNSPGA